jgi:glycosyl transferase family 2
MIIVNNDSTDDGPNRVGRFSDSRIRLVDSVKRGPSAARNVGINLAKGEWLLFLDADDLLESAHLESLLKSSRENPRATVVGGGWKEFVDDPAKGAVRSPSASETLSNTSIAFTPWVVHAALTKRSALNSHHLWEENLDRFVAEDVAFWFRLIADYEVAVGATSAALYRLNTEKARNDLQPSIWYRGVQEAIKSNVAYLTASDRKVTAAQAEQIMRVFSTVYEKAVAASDTATMQASLVHAQEWLDEFFALGGNASLPMFSRRLLGLRNFLRLKTALA